MTGFELRIYGFRSDCSNNCAATIVHVVCFAISVFVGPIFLKFCFIVLYRNGNFPFFLLTASCFSLLRLRLSIRVCFSFSVRANIIFGQIFVVAATSREITKKTWNWVV